MCLDDLVADVSRVAKSPAIAVSVSLDVCQYLLPVFSCSHVGRWPCQCLHELHPPVLSCRIDPLSIMTCPALTLATTTAFVSTMSVLSDVSIASRAFLFPFSIYMKGHLFPTPVPSVLACLWIWGDPCRHLADVRVPGVVFFRKSV